jgi:hypothetical protein
LVEARNRFGLRIEVPFAAPRIPSVLDATSRPRSTDEIQGQVVESWP